MNSKSFKRTLLMVASLAFLTTGRCVQPDTDTTFLLHFESSLTDVTGEPPSIGSGVVFEPGVSGNAAFFTASNSVHYSSASNILAESGTLEFLIKPRWNGNDGLSHDFLTWGGLGGFLFQKDGGNYLRFIANRFGAFGGLPEMGVGVSIANEWISNQWHHVAYTWSLSSLKLYVDGSIRAQSSISNLPPISSFGAMQIGAEANVNQAEVVLDELRLSSRERSAAEIAESIVGDVPVSGLSVQPPVKDLAVAESYTPSLIATTMVGVLSAPASLATWTSANTNVAAVSSNGMVTAHNEGTTTLTATLKGQFAILTLNVTPPVPPTGFRITQVWATTNGTLTLAYPSDTNCYYTLYRGDLSGITNARALRMGEAGDGVFSDTIGAQASAFFRVRQIPIGQPQDLDNDGIDDVYELDHPDSLDPLNASDASAHYLGNPRSNLEEYWQERGSNVFRILQVSTKTNGTVELQFPSDPSCYYILYRSDNPAIVGTASDLRLGLQGVDIFSASAGTNQAGFFRVRQVTLNQPLDTDADGMDDLYELRRANYLNPLVQSDAALHYNGNPKSNLEEYWAFEVLSDSLSVSGWKQRFSVGHDAWAIRDDGSLWAWGGLNSVLLSAHKPTTFPVRLDLGQDWVAFGGYSASSNGVAGRVALKADRTAWLVVSNGLALPLDGSQGWKFISDDYNPVGIKLDGSLWSVKRPGLASTRVGANSNWKAACQANASIVRIVAIKSDGSLWTLQNTIPERSTRLGSANNWISVVAGDNHCLAIDSNSRLIAWGYNSEGQLGDGTITDKDFNSAVDHGTGWLSVDAQFNRSVGVKSDGTVWVWGSTWHSIGAAILTPTQVGTKSDWVEAKVGSWLDSYVMAARSDGSLWAVGGAGVPPLRLDFHGQIGSNAPPVSEFLMIGTDNDWAKVSTAGSHSLAIKKNGNLWGWGNHGFGSSGYSLLPQKLDSENLWEEVSAKTEWGVGVRSFNIATKVGSTAWAWGSVLEIVAPYLTTTNVSAPWQITTNAWLPNRASQLSSGPHHTLKVDTNGYLLVWGTNLFGELGVNFNYVDATNPANLSWGWSSVVAGTNSSMGIKTNGAMWGWGSMIEILGTTSTATVVSNPVQIDARFGGPGEQEAFGFSAEVRNDGSLWTMGEAPAPVGSYPGDGTSYDYDYPVPVVAYPPSKPFYLALGPQISGKLLVDANRDGEITDSDATYNVAPYRFWVNDDDDVDTSDPSAAEQWPVAQPDCQDDLVDGIRDLEDFTRLKIVLDGMYDAVRQGQIRVGLEWRNTIGSPSLKVWRNKSPGGGTEYLTDVTVAEQHLALSQPGVVQGNSTYMIPAQYWEDIGLSALQPYGNLLFEGCSEGKGRLTVVFYNGDGSVIGEGAGVWLDLKNIKTMYQRHDGSGLNQWPSVTFDADPQEAKEFIVFVHGWNMSPEGASSFSETMFKRLWHRGFKGRFAAFRWNTYWSSSLQWLPYEIGDPIDSYFARFNDSEYNAWLAGEGLKNFVNSLPSDYAKNMAAHSMGNIVAGSALLSGMSIENYALLQAAVPAACYDDSASVEQTQQYRHYGIQMWDSPSPDSDADPATRALAYRGKLKNVPGNLVSFFLTNDYATFIPWEINNDQTKPPLSLTDQLPPFRYYEYKPDNLPGQKIYRRHDLQQGLPIEIFDYYVTNPIEGVSLASRSWGKAAGAYGNTRGAIDKSVDLSSPIFNLPGQIGFGDQHSGEFNYSIQHLKPFYDELLRQFDIRRNP